MKVFAENVEQRQILSGLSDYTPDMIWAKDLDGKYIFVNQAICDGLFMCSKVEALGRDDAEISMDAKEKYGKDNHTFGDVCGNSDQVVRNCRNSQSFHIRSPREEFFRMKRNIVFRIFSRFSVRGTINSEHGKIAAQSS